MVLMSIGKLMRTVKNYTAYNFVTNLYNPIIAIDPTFTIDADDEWCKIGVNFFCVVDWIEWVSKQIVFGFVYAEAYFNLAEGLFTLVHYHGFWDVLYHMFIAMKSFMLSPECVI